MRAAWPRPSTRRGPRSACRRLLARTRHPSGVRPELEVRSQVTRSWQPDHVCDRSPDSVEFGAEIGAFCAHGRRRITKNGLLTLDQEIEGSNPSSPAKLSTN